MGSSWQTNVIECALYAMIFIGLVICNNWTSWLMSYSKVHWTGKLDFMEFLWHSMVKFQRIFVNCLVTLLFFKKIQPNLTKLEYSSIWRFLDTNCSVIAFTPTGIWTFSSSLSASWFYFCFYSSQQLLKMCHKMDTIPIGGFQTLSLSSTILMIWLPAIMGNLKENIIGIQINSNSW